MIFDTSLHRVVLLGLDGAGKTTVLYRLKWQEIVLPPPTIGFNCEKVGRNFYRLNINFSSDQNMDYPEVIGLFSGMLKAKIMLDPCGELI